MRTRAALGVILVVIGAVWFGQGVGVIHGSFMTGQVLWAVIGTVAMFLGGSLIAGVRRAKPRRALSDLQRTARSHGPADPAGNANDSDSPG